MKSGWDGITTEAMQKKGNQHGARGLQKNFVTTTSGKYIQDLDTVKKEKFIKQNK
jgi:hypothetical protein